ncbi:hypothetical protein [Burkholderia multivorans]|uniref:hypothetical protein n=1 Tax=Burkholderia multivorans TaxID=87883 RepID=UPI0021C18F35|nr:hypothetical protein [Burkholderia multivorans]
MKQSDLPAFGSPLGAGLFAGQYVLGSVNYALVIAPKSAELMGTVVANAAAMAQATSYVDGQANTVALAASGQGLGATIAALTIDGQGDLYIPSRDELATIIANLDVFPGSALAVGAAEGFDEAPYLTSTALGPDLLWNQNPYYGWQAQDDLSFEIRVRPIWRIVIDDVEVA